jgi:hypothetical protein
VRGGALPVTYSNQPTNDKLESGETAQTSNFAGQRYR